MAEVLWMQKRIYFLSELYILLIWTLQYREVSSDELALQTRLTEAKARRSKEQSAVGEKLLSLQHGLLERTS